MSRKTHNRFRCVGPVREELERAVELSTRHSASSYGVPVALIGADRENAYGPDDPWPRAVDGISAGAVVVDLAARPTVSADFRRRAVRFAAASPHLAAFCRSVVASCCGRRASHRAPAQRCAQCGRVVGADGLCRRCDRAPAGGGEEDR